MPGPPDILARIDAIMAELAELRELLLAGAEADDEKEAYTVRPLADDDLADASLIEISQAVELFNRPADSLRWMCRKQGCGKKVAGRWMASPARIRRHLNGG